MLNEELIRQVVVNIEFNNRWNQSSWAQLNNDQYDDNGEIRPEAFEGVVGYVFEGEDFALVDRALVAEGSCGASFCFAGHTVLLAGDSILIHKEGGDASHCMDKDGNIHVIEERAQQLLGLTNEQVDVLFDASTGDKDFELYKKILTVVTGVNVDG